MNEAKLLLTRSAMSVLRPLLPPGLTPELTSDTQERGAAVYVLRAEECQSFISEGSHSDYVIILWLDGAQAPDAQILSHPRVVGALSPAAPAATVYTTIKSALALLRDSAGDRGNAMLEKMLDIGRALAAEKDLDRLLGLILGHARSLTGADGASIYTRDPSGALHFRLWQNASRAGDMDPQKSPAGDNSIAGYVARTGQVVRIEDAYVIDEDAPYRFNPALDRAINYRTRSLLTLPLTSKAGDVVGVLQLINRKRQADAVLRADSDFASQVLSFDDRSCQVALALAGQAGVALENSLLYADIERLFEGFIMASVQAIEARDPTTAGHSFRVAEFTEKLALAVDRCDLRPLRDVTFTREQLREIRYAALLHDFGKVGVREHVLVKAKKLYPLQLDLLRQRFRHAGTSGAEAAYRELLDLARREGWDADRLQEGRREVEGQISQQRARLEHYLSIVLRANEPSVTYIDVAGELREVLEYRFPDGEQAESLLSIHDFANLTLPKGNLGPEERAQIESHVSHTFQFLSLIPWTRDLAALPAIAYAHHEKLDGSGYPRRLCREEIPVQARMMTISDVYDALTAPDRPYKQAISADHALDILGMEARNGKIDADLLRVFVEAGCYLPVVGRH